MTGFGYDGSGYPLRFAKFAFVSRPKFNTA